MFLGGTKLPTRATKFLEMFRVFLFVGFPFGAATLAKDTDIMRSVILDRRYVVYPPERDTDKPFLIPDTKTGKSA